ncbi:SMI1/KNR4 family protein [Acinetobacter johnsonii]|uniref:SMI1/KNR4 family protein n=1 Tax=Acinetobacter johnsonii TaxID=40214 RepID=UPI0024472ADF|nr:SMI1/KNR4 family protein [Acinetobacter johnsonii]MDH2045390.1 SMI1/KNR4 family protein [Acinetobacter johnsonii]
MPFAEGRNGDYLMIDLDPSEQGQYGQIIELQNESWERNVISSSLEDFIQINIDQLKKPDDIRYAFILDNG